MLFLFLTRRGMPVNSTIFTFPPDVSTLVCLSYWIAAVDMLCKKQDADEM